jgi:hypothetical protein
MRTRTDIEQNELATCLYLFIFVYSSAETEEIQGRSRSSHF